MNNKFSLGFWNYVNMGAYGPEAVKDWTDCGMNLCLSPVFDPDLHDPADLLVMLDECERQDVKLIISDKRALWQGASSDPTAYRERFIDAYKTFGKHPSVFGFYIGDEPRAVESEPQNIQFIDAITAYKIQLEVAPELTPLINFLPFFKGVEKLLLADSFEQWADHFVKESGLRMFSYDCYSQLKLNDPEESGIHGYFENLNKYSAAAKRANIPFWVTNLSTAHYRYRCPTEDDFRWQLNTSIACGAKCIWWFIFYMLIQSDAARSMKTMVNFRVPPIDEHWERTETFVWLSRVQRSFQHTFGKIMADLVHIRTYHCLKAYGGYELLSENIDPIIKKVECNNNLPSILSIFHDSCGRKYIVIVNNSQTESGLFTYHFASSVKHIYQIIWGGHEIDVEAIVAETEYRKTDEGSKISAWLAPGQMEVYRLEFVITSKQDSADQG